MNTQTTSYDVAIIGGGVSGTALLHTLARYTDLSRLVLLEKYAAPGQVNSHPNNNSQTLHIGEIETNYSLSRSTQVKLGASMVRHYTNQLPETERAKIIRRVPKMLLGVGAAEVAQLEQRYAEIKLLFPELQKLSGSQIHALEPAIMQGRDPNEPVCALYNPDGHAVDFAELAASFVRQAQKSPHTVDVFFKRSVTNITVDSAGMYHLHTAHGEIQAKTVVVDADAYSLWFAKKLGYGQEYSLIPMAGTFYFSSQLLHGKVYTCQDAKLLYTAVHGDPDLSTPNQTRWGPTVRFFPVLERKQYRTMIDYFHSAGLGRLSAWRGFVTILSDSDRAYFFLKNLLYEIPLLGTWLFARTARKICPSLKTADLRRAKGYGGMRLQRVNVNTGALEVGERKIVGHNIIFNMTPSPGASICLHTALQDTEQIIRFFNDQKTFNKSQMVAELQP